MSLTEAKDLNIHAIPDLVEHSQIFLQELGFNTQQIENLIQQGMIKN